MTNQEAIDLLDNLNEGSDGRYLEGGEEIDDGMAWMPIPEPWKGKD